METVIEAVNTVQDVPLRLNPYIVEAINWCWAENLTPGKFPDSQEVPPPESANDNQEDPQVVKLAKYAERQRIKLNHGCRSSVATMASMLATMVMLEDKDFYLPHSLDFRSRIYPIPSFNHYGADHQKALFYSARPKRVNGAVGAQWLYVHIANCADFKDENGVKLTKKSINDRIAWVQDNWDMLLRSVKCSSPPTMSGPRPTSRSCSWPLVANWSGCRRTAMTTNAVCSSLQTERTAGCST